MISDEKILRFLYKIFKCHRYFDIFIYGNSAGYDGAWNVYPYFESGNIIISDINTGFYIVRKSE